MMYDIYEHTHVCRSFDVRDCRGPGINIWHMMYDINIWHMVYDIYEHTQKKCMQVI